MEELSGQASNLVLGIGVQISMLAVKSFLLYQYKGCYREADIRAAFLSPMQQLKEDTEAIRKADFYAAQHELSLWLDSKLAVGHRTNMQLDTAVKAFDVVADPLDKLRAAYIVIFADYHRVSLSSSPPNWKEGKREAQNLLQQYYSRMPLLQKAAEEELRALRVNKKRIALLQSFITLCETVKAFEPISANKAHPKFPAVMERAALHVLSSKRLQSFANLLSPKIYRLIESPIAVFSLQGHKDAVSSCSVFAQDSKAISACRDGTLKVWDLSNGQLIYTLMGHQEAVNCCAVFAHGARAISGSGDHTLKVWDLSKRQELYTMQGHGDWVYCCSVFAKNTRAISGSGDHTLKVWDLSDGKAMYTLRGHSRWVSCCAVFSNDAFALSGSMDKTLKLWDLSNGEMICTLSGHKDAVSCCSVFSNDTRAISGSWDCALIVWDLTTCLMLFTLNNEHRVHCCSVFSNGSRAVSGSWDDPPLRVWNLSSRRELYALQGGVNCCSVFANDSKVIGGNHVDHTLTVWLLPSEDKHGAADC